MTATARYLEQCRRLLERIESQAADIATAADWFAGSILAGRVVHVFGSGHSRMAAEEMWPRYGSFAGFHPIVELSLTYHNQVVGANGQRQAMFLENVSGLAEKILRNFAVTKEDSALVISSSGSNCVPVEVAEGFRARGLRVVGLVGKDHMAASTSKHPDGVQLGDVCDLVLDTGIPAGDSLVDLEGLDTPVAPGSTVGGAAVINAVKAEVAERLVAAGQPPKVLTATCRVGAERAAELFESAYDEHARRVAPLYANLGIETT